MIDSTVPFRLTLARQQMIISEETNYVNLWKGIKLFNIFQSDRLLILSNDNRSVECHIAAQHINF